MGCASRQGGENASRFAGGPWGKDGSDGTLDQGGVGWVDVDAVDDGGVAASIIVWVDVGADVDGAAAPADAGIGLEGGEAPVDARCAHRAGTGDVRCALRADSAASGVSTSGCMR